MKKKTDLTTITLSRYTFDTSGKPTSKDELEIDDDFQSSDKHKEESVSTSGNSTAKNLEGFKNSVKKNHGYYIGRYEARTGTERSFENNDLTPVTEKGTDYVYNWITQPNASKQCQAMYQNKTTFTSDLMNSYAWDTAIVFLQEFDDRIDKTTKYSRQRNVSNGFANKGTNNTSNIDKICNVYDMASNGYELTTETSTNPDFPCTVRGGAINRTDNHTSYRYYFRTTSIGDTLDFRPILYIEN